MVKWGEKIIRFGNLHNLPLPDPVPEKRKEIRMRRDVALFILFRRNFVVRIGKGTNLLNDVYI